MWIPVAMTLSMPAPGGVPVAQDFAFGFTVESEAQGALWQLDLPDAVYRSVIRADLGDMRVFNSAGQVVPHALTLPAEELEPVPAPVAVPFFPLYTRGGEETPGQMLRIITDEKGAIVNATSTAVPTDETGRVTAYLLDTSKIEHTPHRLKLIWERPEETGFTASVAVASSDDLSHWSTLVKEITLADLKSGEAVLAHNEIELPIHRARYMRITWPETLREVTLTRVQVLFRAAGKPLPHRWLEVSGTPNQDDPRVFDFDTHGHWPADMAQMDFASSNIMVNATLMSRSTRDASWRTRHSGIFYTLEHEGKALKNEPVGFGTTSDRFWRFRLEDKERLLSGSPPTLVLGWMPHLLTFLAQGEPPYTVAFGSATVGMATRPIDTLLSSIDESQEKGLIAPANASAVIVLGGEGKLKPPAAPFPWGTFVLWSVLLAGVVMLAWMVHGLFRQMGPSDGPPETRE